MKLVKKPMTLEQYEAKYPKYQTKLLSFSDKEIKEFNDKFYKSNGNKQIPDKYALLNKGKWIHIKDRYYQVPRISKLGKCGIAIGSAAAVACAVVLPIVLNSGFKLSAEEFMNSITYVSTFSKYRKYKIEGTVKTESPGNKGTGEKQIVAEMDGQKAKLGAYVEGELDFEHIYYDDEGRIFTYEYDSEGTGSWRRSSSTMGELEEFFIPFDELANNYKKFNKISSDTWEIKDYTYKYKHPSLPVEVDIKTSYQFGFNNDKTIKSGKGSFTISMPLETRPIDSTVEVLSISSDVIFKDVKTHTITDAIPFVKPQSENMKMSFDNDKSMYVNDGSSFWLAKGYNETFTFQIIEDENGQVQKFNRFALADYSTGEAVPINITKDNIINIYNGDTEIAKTEYDVTDNIIVFNNSIGDVDNFIKITMKFNDCDYYAAYAQAYNLTEDPGQFIVG